MSNRSNGIRRFLFWRAWRRHRNSAPQRPNPQNLPQRRPYNHQLNENFHRRFQGLQSLESGQSTYPGQYNSAMLNDFESMNDVREFFAEYDEKNDMLAKVPDANQRHQLETLINEFEEYGDFQDYLLGFGSKSELINDLNRGGHRQWIQDNQID